MPARAEILWACWTHRPAKGYLQLDAGKIVPMDACPCCRGPLTWQTAHGTLNFRKTKVRFQRCATCNRGYY